MPRPGLFFLLILVLSASPSSSSGAEEKDRLVRATEALTPEDERKSFHLPEGFSIQLFADEVQLGGKPINMAFDARGRLWVSSTREYPYAVPKIRWSDPQGTRAKDSKDTIRILEDTDGDGRADKATIFADELNIPTGVLPYKNGCIAWSIPNILYLEDTDGDGKCDSRRILFGPLGWERDTHGMISSLRLGLDGWIYATHGFSNTSHFEVRPENRKAAVNETGLTLDITSGSVFRFKPDGSRVEPWTTGQVNPFGLCWDSWGNLYSADCHSNPITQLIRGACYPSFGKPHDGLGFAPNMCEHAHGSTGLCGIIYIDGGVWGPEWDDHMFVGNCVTSRVNHDHITFTGATPKANEAPDFLTSDDPWFRPVDLQLGPDSALYVADFYNRIIGHYEVPLDHPGRDRGRGRIWRVVREGFTNSLNSKDDFDESYKKGRADGGLVARELARRNIARLHLAAGHFHQQLGEEDAKVLVGECFQRLKRGNLPHMLAALVAALHGKSPDDNRWVVELLGENHTDWWEEADPQSLSALLETIADTPRWNSAFAHWLTFGLGHSDPRVRRSAMEAIARHPSPALVPQVINVFLTTNSSDEVLRHSARLALRSCLSSEEGFARMHIANVDSPPARELLLVAASVPSEASAAWMLSEIVAVTKRGEPTNSSLLATAFTHIARHLPADRDGELVSLAQKHFGDDLDIQLDLLSAIRDGRQSKNLSFSQPLAAWSTELTKRLLAVLQTEPASTWHPITPPTDTNPNPWHPETRKCADGNERLFLDSHPPGGEKLTGTLRSAPFELPSKLTFWLAGHRGFPTANPHEKTFVRLVENGTNKELARAYPPRHDAAQQFTWTFSGAPTGTPSTEQVFLELTDNDAATAYAWLAAGGFDPVVVTIPTDPQQRDKRIRMLALLVKGGSESDAARTMLNSVADKATLTPDTRSELAAFLAASCDASLSPLAPLARDGEVAPAVFAVLQTPKTASEELSKAFRTLPFRSQAKLAAALAGSVSGANQLLKLATPAILAEPLVSSKLNALDDGKISQRLKALTASLPPQNEALNKLITRRLNAFDPTKADASRGEQIFTAVCFICHRIGVRGNLVGPQLDGIGARGIERLLEDILDPNRAVDPAFRLHLVKRKDGSLYAGLLRREEGDALIFADAAAQETRIPKQDITANDESVLSLMPPGLGEALTEQQLHDLLAYLLARK